MTVAARADEMHRGLIVDDESAFVEVLNELLTERLAREGWNFQFIPCTDPKQAEEHLRTNPPGTFELVLTDMLFPAADDPDADPADQDALGHEVVTAAVAAEARVIVGFTKLKDARLYELKGKARELGADLFVGRGDLTTQVGNSATPEILDLLDESPGARRRRPSSDAFAGDGDLRRKVGVVHGANGDARDAMFEFLEAWDLIPIDFDEAIPWTEETSPPHSRTLAELIDKPQAIVVLLTPDEDVALHPHLEGRRGEADAGRQPRPNVFVEMGMALANNPKRTILVQLGEVRIPSDIDARAIVKLDDSEEKREQLIQKLRIADCAIRRKPGAEQAGRFEDSVAPFEAPG